MTDHTQTISDLTLERYRLGELPTDEAAFVSDRAASDPALRARLASLAESDAEIHRQYPADVLARAIVERASAKRSFVGARTGTWRWVVLASASALVVAVVAVVPIFDGPSDDAPGVTGPSSDADRVKGDDALVIYRKAGSNGEVLADGDAVRSGDLIRVAYRCAHPRFGVILSIDGRGAVTRHLPVSGGAAAPLLPGSTTMLDQAYELDAAPRWERFFLITGDTAFDVQAVMDAAHRAAAGAGEDPPATLPLVPGLQQASFLLRKIS